MMPGSEWVVWKKKHDMDAVGKKAGDMILREGKTVISKDGEQKEARRG